MKKMKAAAVALLGLTALVALPSCANNGGQTSSESSEVVTYYNVVLPSSVNGAYVAADKTSAVEGEEVKLTVVLTDSDEYTLDSVKMGDTVLTGTADANNANVLTYAFNMPAGNANITVNTSKIQPVVKAHAITTVGEHVVFTKLPERADAEEVVEFTVSVESGYNVTSVKAAQGETEVTLSGSLAAGYSFTMPAGDVVITAEVVGNIVVLSEDTAEIDVPNVNGDLFKSGLDDVIESYTNEGVTYSTDNSNSFFIRGGTEVTLTAKHHNRTIAENFYLNGEKLVADAHTEQEILDGAKNTYTFTMPYGDAKITADHVVRSAKIKVEQNDLLTTEIYTKDAEGAKVPYTDASIPLGEKVYVSAKLNEGVEAIIDSVYLEYDKYTTKTGLITEVATNYSTKWTDDSTDPYEAFGFEDANTKFFTLPGATYTGEVRVKFSVLTPKFAGQSVVGKFVGWNVYGSGSTGWSKKTTEIDEYGRALQCANSSTKGGLVESVEGNLYKVVKGGTSKLFYHEDNIIVMSEKADSYYDRKDGAYVSDVDFMVKSGVDVASAKAKKYDGILISEIYDAEGNSLGAVALDTKQMKVHMNVTITLVTGTSFADTGSTFKVTKGTEVIYSNVIELPESDPVAGLAFVGKTYKVDYLDSDGYGGSGKADANISILFNENLTATVNAANGGGYKIENELADYSYEAATRTITGALNGSTFTIVFDEAFQSATGTGELVGIKDAYYNIHNLSGKTLTVVA